MHRLATIGTPSGVKRSLYVHEIPPPRELTLLFALCEHVNKTISIDDLCYRLRISENAVRIAACRLRKKITENWTIQNESNLGLRIVYLENPFHNATKTTIEFDKDFLAAKKRRVHLVT